MTVDLDRRSLAEISEASAVFELAFIAISNGLFSELARQDAATSAALAEATGTDETYVGRWCDAAYAYGLLDFDDEPEGAEPRFALTDLGASFRPEVEETTMPMAVESILSARISDRLSEYLRTGEQPGEDMLSDFENVIPWFGEMLEARFKPLFLEYILAEIELFQSVDQRNGVVVDFGCGNGWYLRELAKRFEHVRGIGVDNMEESIERAREKAEREEVASRLEFRAADVLAFDEPESAEIVALNRTLHHLWEERGEMFEVVEQTLVDGGAAIVWEPAYPEQTSDLRDPERRGLAVRNFAEHAMGNRLLRPAEIATEFDRMGMTAEIEEFADSEAVVVARKR